MIGKVAREKRREIASIAFLFVLLGCRLTAAPPVAPQPAQETLPGAQSAGQGEPEQAAVSAGAQSEATTSGSLPPAEEISPSALNRDIPDNIVTEISFYGGGGGGGECEDSFAANSRVIDVSADGFINIDTCYWDENEAVTVTVFSPDGKTLLLQSFIAALFIDTHTVGVHYFYNPLLLEMGRPYRFQFASATKTAVVEATFVPAAYPVKGFAADKTIFYNFRPHETVIVNLYEPFERADKDDPLIQCGLRHAYGFEFKGWLAYQADENGRLLLNTGPGPLPADHWTESWVRYAGADHYLVASGEQSGEAYDPFAQGFFRDIGVTDKSTAEREAQVQACYDSQAEVDQFIAGVGDFLGMAIESEMNAFRFSDPSLAAPYFAEETFQNLGSAIAELDQNNVYQVARFDFENSYFLNERGSVFSFHNSETGQDSTDVFVWVDSCELWTSSYYAKSDDSLLRAEPTRLLPQSIRIDRLSSGEWKITAVNFLDPPGFCDDIHPELYELP